MRKIKQITILLMVVFSMLLTSIPLPLEACETTGPEVRAFWVDAFHDGAKTPAQIDKLINDALRANINTLIVQVRRRGDSYYNNSFEPRTEDPVLPAGFDALQYLIDKAHANQIEVHAWLNTLVAWNSPTPPLDPNHVWNLHGPNTPEEENWVSYYRTQDATTKVWSDNVYSSYYLDPGNPDALDYTVAVYQNVVEKYDVDGIHLDYSRYNGLGWGYNPVSIERYNTRYGATGIPVPEDPRWQAWRQEQTANLVRKIYLNAIAAKPDIKVSSSVIAWGSGPVAEGDWEKCRAFTEVAQDWRGWLEEGILDQAMPMNYDREWNASQQLWYNQWIEWEKDHQYQRQVVIGPAIYLQYIEQSLEQIRRAQAPSASGNYPAGVSMYAYASANLYGCDDYKDPNSAASQALPRQPHVFMPETNEWFYQLLANQGNYLDPVLHSYIQTEPVFPTRARIPDMPWKSHPTHGYIMGTVTDCNGNNYDHLKIEIDGWVIPRPGHHKPEDFRVHRDVYTDGSSWFGAAELLPGVYKIQISNGDFAGRRQIMVYVRPGQVTVANFEQFRPKKPLRSIKKIMKLINDAELRDRHHREFDRDQYDWDR